MADTNYIAAIDLGSSLIVGVLGKKNNIGMYTIVACETEKSDSFIRRGAIYNIEQAAHQIKGLFMKLGNRIPGEREKIIKTYVGVGGQSLRSLDHIVTKSLGVDGEVTNDVINNLNKECQEFKPDALDVVAVASPAYYLDGKLETNPVGIPCNRIEARYKLIVCRPSLRRNIATSIASRAKIEIVGIFASPLTLADMVLSDDAKDLGCALINFGAGVTTLTVYHQKRLVSTCVIPLGGNLITKDIASLNIVADEAERLKKSHGDALPNKEDSAITQNGKIDVASLNEAVEARVQEILENVYARLEETGMMESLGAGIFITGGGASLKNLDEAIRAKFKMEVRHASIRKGIIEKSSMVIEPEYAVAISLMIKGDKKCTAAPLVKPPIDVIKTDIHVTGTEETPKDVEVPQNSKVLKEENFVEEVEIKPPAKKKKKKKGEDILGRAATFVSRLFDDEYEDPKKKEEKAEEEEDDDDLRKENEKKD